MEPLNFFDLPTTSLTEEVFTTLHQDQRVKIERIASHGQVSPVGFWYDQPIDEWVLLVRGEAALAFEDGRVCRLTSGDHVFIAKHERHRVDETSADALWLAVHLEGKPPDRPEAYPPVDSAVPSECVLQCGLGCLLQDM